MPFGAFVQVGDGIEGLVHISEMAVHHVDLPEQVVTPGEELWVKIIDIDLQRRRISLSIKQAAEGGEVSEEYREAFGEHAYDEEGNYIGFDYAEGEFTPETEAQAAWADFAEEAGTHVVPPTTDATATRSRRPTPRCRRGRPSAAASGRSAEALPRSEVEAPAAAPEAPAEAPAEGANRSNAGCRAKPGAAAVSSGQRHRRGVVGVADEEQHRVEELEFEQRRPRRRRLDQVDPGVGGRPEEFLGRGQSRLGRRGAAGAVAVAPVTTWLSIRLSSGPDAAADHRLLVQGVA